MGNEKNREPAKLQNQYMSFGKYKVVVSDEEFRRLEKVLLNYLDSAGTSFGFVFFLLGGAR